MEEGYWVVVGNMRAWVSSMHLVHEKEIQLRRIQEHWEMHRQQQQATGGASRALRRPAEPTERVLGPRHEERAPRGPY